jgi:hypothetical protein
MYDRYRCSKKAGGMDLMIDVDETESESLGPSSLSYADVSEEDIKLVMEQAQVNRAQAIKALQDHGYARLHLALSRTRPFRALTPPFPAVTLWMPFLL